MDSKEAKQSKQSVSVNTSGKELDYTNRRDYDEIRVLKQSGFFGVTLPIIVRIPYNEAASTSYFTTPFFIANRSYEILSCIERHEVAAADAGAVTLMLKKVPSGTAPASGSDVLSAGINLKATANINQAGAILQTNKIISSGDSLALIVTGSYSNLSGVTVAVLLKAI